MYGQWTGAGENRATIPCVPRDWGCRGLQQRAFRLSFFNTRVAICPRAAAETSFILRNWAADEGAGSTRAAARGGGRRSLKFGNYVINNGARRGRDALVPIVGH